MRKLWKDECGFVITAELVLFLTIAVLGTVVGLTAVRDAVASEMVDLSHAFGAVDQSFHTVGIAKPRNLFPGGVHAGVAGFGFNDRADDCDCVALTFTDVIGKSDSSTGVPNEGNL